MDEQNHCIPTATRTVSINLNKWKWKRRCLRHQCHHTRSGGECVLRSVYKHQRLSETTCVMWIFRFRPIAHSATILATSWTGAEKTPQRIDGVENADGKLIAVRDEKNVRAPERIGFLLCVAVKRRCVHVFAELRHMPVECEQAWWPQAETRGNKAAFHFGCELCSVWCWHWVKLYRHVWTHSQPNIGGTWCTIDSWSNVPMHVRA